MATQSTDTKLLIKLLDNSGNYKWVHLCYVDSNIYADFLKLSRSKHSLNRLVSEWYRSEFKLRYSLKTLEDLNTLKQTIKEKYSKLYPGIYRESDTDRQGWLRIWITNNMREEIEKAHE